MEGDLREEGDLYAEGEDRRQTRGRAGAVAEVSEALVGGACEIEAGGGERGVEVGDAMPGELEAKLGGGRDGGLGVGSMGVGGMAVENPGFGTGEQLDEAGEERLAAVVAEGLQVDGVHGIGLYSVGSEGISEGWRGSVIADARWSRDWRGSRAKMSQERDGRRGAGEWCWGWERT